MQILLVEDDSSNEEVARTILELQGYQVVCVRDGQEALARCEAQHFDAILMDWQLPLMDGVSVTRRLREHPSTRTTPIIFVSARASKASCDEAMAAGATAYLPKPYTRQALISLLRSAIKASSGE